MPASTKLTPEQRTERARQAGLASHQSPERHVRALERLVDQLTDDQERRLLVVLARRVILESR